VNRMARSRERDGAVSATRGGTRGKRGRNGGFGILPFVVEPSPYSAATDATWAWSLRRLARVAVWLLPCYALLFGGMALYSDGEGLGSRSYPLDGRSLYLLGWAVTVWVGLLAVLALTALLVVTRTRWWAVGGMSAALAGIVLMLPFTGVGETAPVFGVNARVFVLLGSAVYSLGWALTGWAVSRSRVFSVGDGTMLMIAAPLLGIAGALLGALQTFGAVFVLAAGIGVAWRAGRLVPAIIARQAAAASVATPVAPESTDPLAAG